MLSSLKEESIYFSVSCHITIGGEWFSIMVKEIVFFCTKEMSAPLFDIICVCFYFIVTLFTRSLILVAALFLHLSSLFFANDYNSQTIDQRGFPSCVERTTNMNDRRPGRSGPMRAGRPPSCPSPASVSPSRLFFSNVPSLTWPSCLCVISV